MGINEAFVDDEKLNLLQIELPDCAIFKRRGEEVVALDFRRPEHQMCDAIIYTMAKDMTGILSVDEVYEFVKNAKQSDPIKLLDPKRLNCFMHNSSYKKVLENSPSEHQGQLIDSVRIILHSHMRCSWARKAMDDMDALSMAGNIVKTIGSLVSNDNTNVSRNGVIVLRLNHNIFIKPQTDGERDGIEEINKRVLAILSSFIY